MTYDPTPNDPNGGRPGKGWGAIGLLIVGLVIALALLVTLLGPTETQQANNVPAAPPPNSQPAPPTTP
jgi:flagellar basal body-associated protein FliL